MLKERIQEIFEFTKSESPYRKANKGWINQDIFLDLKPSSNAIKQKSEAAKVTLLWAPLNSLLSNIFLMFVIGSLIVFTSVSFVKGRFNLDLFNRSLGNDMVKVQKNKSFNNSQIKALDSMNSKIKGNLDISGSSKPSKINSFDDKQTDLDHKIITNKIEKQKNRIKTIESSKDKKNLENKKSKSNFI